MEQHRQPEVGEGLEALFSPRAIAIYGASDDVTKIGGRPLQFLLKYGYCGAIYPINHKAATVQGLPAYASVAHTPEVPELVVVAVPPGSVVGAVREVLRGADACVVLFGPRPDARLPFCAAATKQIIASMRTQSLPRLIVVTGAMIGDMPGNVAITMRLMRLMVQRGAHEGMVEDRVEQERLVRTSGLEGWTLVKPPRLTDDAPSEAVDMAPDLSIGMRSRISRAALAAALVREVQSPQHAQQAVYVAQR